MADSMYLIVPDIPTVKQIVRDNFPTITIAWLIGELQTSHIFVKGFSKTEDGKIIIEIPRTLENWQNKILASQYANKLKTKEEAQQLLPQDFE